jgi:hypothetical protein
VTYGEWKKGGIRYAKLKRVVPEFLAPAEVLGFFVAVRYAGGPVRLVNPFTPFQTEYVVAATDRGAVVLRLRRPGVFRAAIAGVEHRGPGGGVGLEPRRGRLTVGGVEYQPISFHRDDALLVGELLGA